MIAFPMVYSYSILENKGELTVEMCLSYDCKPFYAKMSGVKCNNDVTYSDVEHDGGHYDVKLSSEQSANVIKVVKAKILEQFNKMR